MRAIHVDPVGFICWGVRSQHWSMGFRRNASEVSSGIYVHKIEATPVKGGTAFSAMKKMLLIN